MQGAGKLAPVVFDAGAIGNTGRLTLSQTHRVLLASPLAELHFGAPEVLASAKALVNNTDIRIEPRRTVRYHHLLLADHALLLADRAPYESLLLGPAALARANRGMATDALRKMTQPMITARPAVTYREARLLARLMGIVPGRLPAPVPSVLIAA